MRNPLLFKVFKIHYISVKYTGNLEKNLPYFVIVTSFQQNLCSDCTFDVVYGV